MVSQIVCRAPSSLSSLHYIPMYVDDDSSLECMIDCYKEVQDQFGFIQLHVFITNSGFYLNATNDEGQC